jgi:branched-chain amino acid transport system ATP-binding protein
MLSTDKLSIFFGGLKALKDLTIEVGDGEVVGLIGPNGAGKTTAFNGITGVYKPTAGTVTFLGEDITGLKPHDIAFRGLARTFQNIRLFKDLTVLENCLISQHLRVKSSLMGQTLGLPKYRAEEKAQYDRANALLEELGLLQFRNDKSTSLPYGLQRKLEIARALATQPRLLLLDEPAAGMNPAETMAFIGLIKQLQQSHDISVLMIEHHMQLVMGICDKLWVLVYGEEIAQGSPKQVQGNPAVIEAYLGVEEGEEPPEALAHLGADEDASFHQQPADTATGEKGL